MIHEQLAFEVIVLVLHRDCEQAVGLELERVAVDVLSADLNPLGTLDFFVDSPGTTGSLPRNKSRPTA